MNCWKCGNELGTADSGVQGLCIACLSKPAIAILGSIWNLTPKLRWHKVQAPCEWDMLGGVLAVREVKVLQQLWISDLGVEEWRDIPTES